jgi:hypothetical protein
VGLDYFVRGNSHGFAGAVAGTDEDNAEGSVFAHARELAGAGAEGEGLRRFDPADGSESLKERLFRTWDYPQRKISGGF